MTQFAKISQVAHYVPSQVVTNDDLAKIMETDDEWIRSRTGIEERRISQTEQTSDLATEVARQLLDKSGLVPDDLDFIIVATITPDAMMPSTATLVQAKLGASKAFAFDLTAACSGFVFAVTTGEKLIASGRYQRGLVIGAETLSKVLDWQDRRTAVLFGDGAGGVLLEACQEQHFLWESQHSDGSRGLALTANHIGLQSPYSEAQESSYALAMDGRAVYDFALRDVVATMKQVLADSGTDSADLDYFLLHQANDRMLDKMAKKLGVDREKLPANMMRYGNTSAASIPILLSECVQEGRLRLDGSQQVMIAGFGGGLTWGVLLLKL